MRRRQVLAALAAAPYASALPAQTATRRFRMGATRWPPDLSLRALGRVERFLRDMADMAAPMVLGGVPWLDAAAGKPFSAALMGELGWQAPPGHPVLLSLGALDTLRRGLAPLYAIRDNQPLPQDWSGLPFDDPAVIRAYSAYCTRAAEIMRPDWLCIAVEVNLLAHARPDAWPAYLRLHRAALAAVKARFPALPVVVTFGAQHFMGMADGADPALQAAQMADIAGECDLIGWSIYPHLSLAVPFPIPDGFYDPLAEFAARMGKPCAITESGTASAPVSYGWVALDSSPERQVQATEALFRLAEDAAMPFVVNWTSHDYPALLARLPHEGRDLAGLWVSSGILDGEGADKAVTPLWRDWLSRQPA